MNLRTRRVDRQHCGDREVELQSDVFLQGVQDAFSGNKSQLTDEQTKARTEFVVQAPETGETALLACNEVLLQDMAKESGGQYLREEQAGQLTRILDPLSSGRVVESDTLLWQSWWWFGAIMTLLGAEWYMRKRAGMM